MRRRCGGAPGWLIVVALSFLSLVMAYMGAVGWKLQHSGVPGRMTVSGCSGGKTQRCWGVPPDTRPATIDDPSHPGQTIEIRVNDPDRSNTEIRYANSGDVGHDVDVHLHYTHEGGGTFAVKDGSVLPLYYIGVGFASGVGAVVGVALLVRRRFRASTAGFADSPPDNGIYGS